MKSFTFRSLLLAGLAGIGIASLLSPSAGCGGGSDNGGKGGSGGTTTGKGGSGGTTTGTGGTTTTGTGGTTTNDGGTATHLVNFTFDTSAQGWVKQDYSPPATAVDRNLGAADGGSASVMVVFDATVDAAGAATSGSLKANGTFTQFSQYIDAIIGFTAPGMNLSGKTLKAMVRLEGTTPFPGGASLHVSSGTGYVYAAGAFTPVVPGTWTMLTVDLAAAMTTVTGFDQTQIVQIGVQLHSGGAPADAGTNLALPAPLDVVMHIDNVTD